MNGLPREYANPEERPDYKPAESFAASSKASAAANSEPAPVAAPPVMEPAASTEPSPAPATPAVEPPPTGKTTMRGLSILHAHVFDADPEVLRQMIGEKIFPRIDLREVGCKLP